MGALVTSSRLVVAWASVLVFQTVGADWLKDLDSTPKAIALSAWILGVILWCAFGVIAEADHLAERLGEPLGTLVLTLSIVVIEVMLISAVMLGADASPTVGRDTMFAVMMIVLNGVVGLALLVGGLHHHEQSYSLPGASAYLSVIIPLTTIAFVLPSVTSSTPDGTLTTGQAVPIAVFTLVLYIVFLVLQTGRHRGFFEGAEPAHAPRADSDGVARHAVLLVATLLPIVLLSKSLGKILDHGISAFGAPLALGGLLIAMIVFTPEGVSALRAAYHNELQRTVNLCLGACLSTVGLTLPAVVAIGLVTGERVVLGLDPTGMVLVGLTLLLSVVTFSGPRTTVLEGAVHLLVFCVYVVLIFSP
jgi:Ca2+:H+ antiporter